MIFGVRTELWKRIQRRYGPKNYQITKKLGLTHERFLPNILLFCEYRETQTYDYVRLLYRTEKFQCRLIPINKDACRYCYSQELRTIPSQGCVVCTRCGTLSRECLFGDVEANLDLVSKRLPRDHSSNIQKRVNHFKYWLHRIQGTETNQLTPQHLQIIKEELDRLPLVPITYDRIRDVLKKLRLQRFYNNAYHILRRFTGNALVEFDLDHEQQLILMFRKIQLPFMKHRGSRVNMLSYFYLIRKFAEILGWQDIADAIPLLKAPDKLRQQDRIWKDICDQVGFPFYRST